MTPRRVVVVGGGMTGARFVADLDAAALRTGRPVSITLVGDEPHAPYNRVLLSDVVAGRTDLGALALPAPPERVRVLRGVAARAIDRARRTVVLEDGTSLGYDTVVLATGAEARIPDVPGLRDGAEPAHGVRVLRTLDDARGIVAALSVARRFAVLGGGVLGVEVAAGLRARGADVVLVHAGPAPMDGQLDGAAAGVLSRLLQDRGVEVVTGAEVVGAERTDGRVRALLLADGSRVGADAVVVAAGIAPRTALATAAGLAVERGVLVADDLGSVDDARVCAIGDCAQPPSGTPGLVATGWDHARRLARRLAGEPPSASADGDAVVRLKAGPISAVGIGDPLLLEADGDLRVVSLSDAGARRSITIAVDGDRLRAAACVGAPAVAAELQVIFERALPVPADPAHLLIDRTLVAASADSSALVRIPDSATLCRCNGVTKAQIIAAFRAGDRTVADVASRTRATTGCGGCHGAVHDALQWLTDAEPEQSSSTPTVRAVSGAAL